MHLKMKISWYCVNATTASSWISRENRVITEIENIIDHKNIYQISSTKTFVAHSTNQIIILIILWPNIGIIFFLHFVCFHEFETPFCAKIRKIYFVTLCSVCSHYRTHRHTISLFTHQNIHTHYVTILVIDITFFIFIWNIIISCFVSFFHF